MVVGRRMQRRLVLAGLAAVLAVPALAVGSASAAVLFSCATVDGSATLVPGFVHDRNYAPRANPSLSSHANALAGPEDIRLASTTDAGVKGSSNSSNASISADGTKVAFASSAVNLDPADTDSVYDVFVKDVATGDLALVSTSDTGVKGNGDSSVASISADGTKVAFSSSATNLDPADHDTVHDIYVKDLSTGDLVLASASTVGVKGAGNSDEPSLSGDGSEVTFSSLAANIDPADSDSVSDVYVKDLSTGALALASTSDVGVKGNGNSQRPVLSTDGAKIGFESFAGNLDPADTDTTSDVYVKDLSTGDLRLVSTSDAGAKGNSYSQGPALSADGAKVGFMSSATNLDAADADSLFDVYVKDLGTGELTLASTSDNGVKGNDNSLVPALSADGTRVAFWTYADNFDPREIDYPVDLSDMYVKNLATGDLTLASASDKGVKGNSSSYSGSSGLSADGAVIAFYSEARNLDPLDTDTLDDVYVKHLPSVPTSIGISGCSNGQSGTVSLFDVTGLSNRPLGCPTSLGGAAGNDYPDQTPLMLGSNPSLRIDWATGPDSFGVAKLKMGTTGTQWRAVLVIQSSTGHDTPATNQYLPASFSGSIKTKLKGRIDWAALDSFDCTSNTVDPISWLDLTNNGSFIVKNA